MFPLPYPCTGKLLQFISPLGLQQSRHMSSFSLCGFLHASAFVFFHDFDFFSVIGCSWGALGAHLGALGRSWGTLGALLGCSCGVLSRSWTAFRRSWSTLGASWGALGRILGPLGCILGKISKKPRGESVF